MKRILFFSLLLLLVPIRAASQQFVPGCQLKGQLKTLSQAHPLDNTSPNEGLGVAPSEAQNRAKNNFCAANTPVEVNISNLRSLESRTEAALTAAGIPLLHPRGLDTISL
jgi:hypothetical protein